MKRLFFIAIFFSGIWLTGCAALQEILLEVKDITASGEVGTELQTALFFIDDFINNPGPMARGIAVGYGTALLRRWYKKKQGAKSL